MMQERDEANWERVHPWFGPCDGNESDGSCSACANVRNGVVTVWQLAWEKEHGSPTG